MTIGETLKRARKKMDLTLDDVAHTTKIAKMFLIALENDDITSLPQGVYTRNFLRTYAKFLKLDEDIITAEYHEQYAIKPHFIAQHEQTKLDNLTFKKKRNRYLTILLILIAVPALGFFLYQKYGPGIDGFFDQWKEPPPVGVETPSAQTPPADEGKAQVPKEQPGGNEPVKPAEPAETVDPAAPDSESQNQQGSESEDVEGEGDPPIETETQPPPEQAAEIPIEEPQLEEPVYLPVIRLEDVLWTPPENQGNEIEDMFAIEGLARVWVKVTVDGVVLTERYLDKGMVRYYRYGQVNSVIVGDSRYVVIQDGTAFRKFPQTISTTISVDGFGPGEFMKRVNANLVRFLPPED